MIRIGIDIAKGKSTVCILKPYGEIVSRPFDITHVEKKLSELASTLLRFDDDVGTNRKITKSGSAALRKVGL